MWIILLSFLVVLCVIQYINFQKKYAFAKDIPCAETNYPLIGCGHLFIGKSNVKRFGNMTKLFNRKGKLFKFWLGPKMVLGTSDPNVLQQILTETVWLDKPFPYKFFEVNYGLFGAKYHVWKGQRKALNSTFNLKVLQSFIPIFINCSKKLVERLDAFSEGATISLSEHVKRFALEMVIRTTMGLDISVLEDNDSYVSKVERYFFLSSRRILSVHHYLDAVYHCSGLYREYLALRNYMDRLILRIVDGIATRLKNVEQKPVDEDGEFKKPQIFVDEMFTNKIKKFTDREIIENVYTMIGAGTDTSATAISYACLLLAFYPDVQQKLYDEVMQVYPSSEPEFTLDSLKKLEYMEMVLKEALRLYPVAPLIGRQNVNDTLVGDLKVPANTMVMIHIYSLHRREDVWGADAAKFDPERFSAARSKDRHPFAFLAFSGGSRNCLGLRYAYISMKIMMVTMVKKFRFQTKLREEELRFKFDAILRLESEHLVQLERPFNATQLVYSSMYAKKKMWLILLSFLVVLCVVQYISFRKKYAFAKDIPSAETNYPLVGCGHLFIGKSTVKRFWNMFKLCNRSNKLFKFWLGPKMFLGTTHPDIAQQILTETVWLDKPFLYNFFEVNYGLFGAKYHIWKGQRKALNSTFNMKILQSFIPIFTDCSKKLVERLDTFPEGATVNILEHVERFAMEMVFGTTLGFDISVLEEAESLVSKIERYFFLTSRRLLSVHHYLDVVYHCSGIYREYLALRNYLDRLILRIVDGIATRLKNVEQKPVDKDEEFKKPQIFVDEMFTNKMRKFTDREIIENVYTIIGAGTDTSATAISYACLLLAFYPDVQQKLYDEVMQVYPFSESEFTLDSLKKLEYMEMVLKEALRLYPVAPFIVRQNVNDTLVGDLKVPANSMLMIHIYSLHRREDVWGADAAKFDPERFSAARSKDRHPFAFLAFSGGSRNCLGLRYAYISMKIMMVTMVKKFRFKTKLREEELRFKFDAILRLESEHLVQLERR
ncbi:uncharacterized protein LOC131428638 [Malaya genurostris]|uniref:uncharacterized protein LOC131428638 n=1 Tax=Malaya genurostris TaxID=325434 RepID=UPI0026F393AD|nr:uncharacterized protein LOC131428638 [Malaya genurostris]